MIDERKARIVCKRLKQSRQMNRILLFLLIIMTLISVNKFHVEDIKIESNEETVKEETVKVINESMFELLDDPELYKLPPLPRGL